MFRRLALLSPLVAAVSVLPAAPRLSIRDYFLLLPESAMPDGINSAIERKALLAGKRTQSELHLIADDASNGYLSVGFEGRTQQGLFEFAIWRSASGEDIIGVNALYTGIGFTEGYLHFYVLRGKDWKDVTQDVFADFRVATFKPKINTMKKCQGGETPDFPHGFHCKLPRKGLTIVCKYEIICEVPVDFTPSDLYARPVVNFHWQKNRFVPK